MLSTTIDPSVEKEPADERGLPKAVIVIPARMDSRRLPGKPLLTAGGKALVHWTYERALQTKCRRVLVATPDREIAHYCDENGIPWRPTRDDHPNGTSRCWEVFRQMRSDAGLELVLNWQVDEPLIEPSDVNRLLSRPSTGISTLVHPVCCRVEDENQTKVIHSYGRCHWFTRSPVKNAGSHIGVYTFTPAALGQVADLPETRHAREERLEQLTWIERGFLLLPVEAIHDVRGINTEEDWQRFKSMVENGS